MTKTKSTKSALFTSVVSLFLCFSMLLGTTFAWFTDSVTSDSNVIKSGNLDIAVEYTLDGKNWNDLDGAKDLFQNGLWEPGHTEVVALRITNNGSLALKYAANMNIVNETVGKNKDNADIVLSEILTVSTLAQQAIDENGNANQIGDITLALAFSGENSVAYENTTTFKAGNVLKNNVELQPGAAHYLILKVDMAETVGNEANAKDKDSAPSINFGINVLATQVAYESDSFDNQYDANVGYGTPEEDDYEVVYIYDLDDFTAFGKAVNSNSTYGGVKVANNKKVWVEVMSDIDMTDAPAIQGTEFAIGNGNNLLFVGVFDGNDHTISNYHIKAAWTYNVSLFRTVGDGFTMKDITFDKCSAQKTNNRESSLLVGTVGGGNITFDNVDIKNSTSTGVAGSAAYVGKMTEGALRFVDCDVDNVTLTSSATGAYNAMFLRDGYSHHDYAESGVWVENCTITNSKSIVNGVEDATVAEYNYTK